MEGFNSYELFRKSNILKQQATYLLELQLDELNVKLYAWDSFFIEQFFDIDQQVVKINIASEFDMMKYLKRIRLDDLGSLSVL